MLTAEYCRFRRDLLQSLRFRFRIKFRCCASQLLRSADMVAELEPHRHNFRYIIYIYGFDSDNGRKGEKRKFDYTPAQMRVF